MYLKFYDHAKFPIVVSLLSIYNKLPAQLEKHTLISTDYQFASICVSGDIDGDLDNDIIIYDSGFELFENVNGQFIYKPGAILGAGGGGAISLELVDMDNDSDLDILVGKEYNFSWSKTIILIQNRL